MVLQNGRHGVGAGVIWRRDRDENALILTNYHILGRNKELIATVDDGTEFSARAIAKDRSIDMALLRVEANHLPTALIADSRNLRIGEFVFAIGHPWGQPNSVTAGLISSVTRMQVRGRREQIEVIRSDARLAPGNSGGPLINANGAVVGINTMIVGGDQGIALPSHVADMFVSEAIGEVTL